ncbi:MAG: tetratricopeptide repeat protein [Bryobacteraceae bacterium]
MTARTFVLPLCLLAVGACSRPAPQTAETKNTSAYVDSRQCAGCHAAIAATYRQTGMGRSFYRAIPANLNVEDFARNNSFDHKLSDRSYRMIQRGDHFFLQRSQVGLGGAEANVVEKEIHYVMGSGNHARSYLHRTPQNRLMEMPVGWYAEKGGAWAMSPGYDREDQFDFRRPISYSCMFCHNGYPAVEPGQDTVGAEPIYPAQMPEGIDCQRCHGPGRQHIEAVQASQPKEKIQSAIVNPRRLPAGSQMEVCMQCHLETTTFPLPNAIQRFGRGTFSYRPGEPLGNYMLQFDHAKGSGHDEKFEIASSAYRLRQSACFLKSNGALQCTTCHDPHSAPRGAAAVTHYAAVCRSCHKTAHEPSPDCTSCHMPKRRTEDVVHVAVTDHKIQRRPPPQPLAARSEHHDIEGVTYQGEVALYYPPSLPDSPDRDLYLALAQVVQKSNLKEGIPKLESALAKHNPSSPEFYFELAQVYLKMDRRADAISAYQRALERNPSFAPALRSLGAALLEGGEPTRAVETLERCRTANPRDAVTRLELAKAYQQTGRLPQALEEAKTAVNLDPDLTAAHYTLANLLNESGDAKQAEQSYREAILVQPDSADAHNDLANLLTARQDFAQAIYHFGIAVKLQPKQAPIRYNFGVALAVQGRFDDAQRQFEQAAILAPGMAEAHESLGNLKARKRDWQGAIRNYRASLAAKPDFGPALLGMGTALGASGDFQGARSFLTRATASPIPGVKEEAADLLRSLDQQPLPRR